MDYKGTEALKTGVFTGYKGTGATNTGSFTEYKGPGTFITGTVIPPQDQSQVTYQFATLGTAVEQLDEVMTRLIGRMGPVLRDPEKEVEVNKKMHAEETLVPLADGIRVFRAKIEEQTVRINDLLSRCEL